MFYLQHPSTYSLWLSLWLRINLCSDLILTFIILIPGIIHFHPVMTHLRMFQKGPTYAGFRIFSYLPIDIKDLSNNVEWFKKALKEFLYMHLFILLMNFLCVKLDKQVYLNLVPFYMFFIYYILLSVCVLCYNYSDTAYNWNVHKFTLL